jgi:hypothetical protein
MWKLWKKLFGWEYARVVIYDGSVICGVHTIGSVKYVVIDGKFIFIDDRIEWYEV